MIPRLLTVTTLVSLFSFSAFAEVSTLKPLFGQYKLIKQNYDFTSYRFNWASMPSKFAKENGIDRNVPIEDQTEKYQLSSDQAKRLADSLCPQALTITDPREIVEAQYDDEIPVFDMIIGDKRGTYSHSKLGYTVKTDLSDGFYRESVAGGSISTETELSARGVKRSFRYFRESQNSERSGFATLLKGGLYADCRYQRAE